ncbi:MAG: hypothetical protein ACJA06_002254 [Halocynthiibacter sp.]|jgi:hypothetical protein
MPEWVRGGGASSVLKSVSLMEEPRRAPKDFEAGPAESGLSSVIEFHSPHVSQRPDHLVLIALQELHLKDVFFAIGLLSASSRVFASACA